MKLALNSTGNVRPASFLERVCLILLCTAAALIGAGCGGRAVTAPAPPPAPPVINILPPPAPPPVKPLLVIVSASSSINPGVTERAAPVILRLYDLKSASTFDAADFFSLMDKESQVLGADLLVRDEYQIKPGERLELSRKLSTGVGRIAALVAFRDLERSIWKASIVIGNPPPAQLQVTIDGRRVQLSAQ